MMFHVKPLITHEGLEAVLAPIPSPIFPHYFKLNPLYLAHTKNLIYTNDPSLASPQKKKMILAWSIIMIIIT